MEETQIRLRNVPEVNLNTFRGTTILKMIAVNDFANDDGFFDRCCEYVRKTGNNNVLKAVSKIEIDGDFEQKYTHEKKKNALAMEFIDSLDL